LFASLDNVEALFASGYIADPIATTTVYRVAIGKSGESMMRLCIELKAKSAVVEWGSLRCELHSRHYRVPIALTRAIVMRESNWQSCVISPKRTVGLMQLMPTTAERLVVTDLCNVDQNVARTPY